MFFSISKFTSYKELYEVTDEMKIIHAKYFSDLLTFAPHLMSHLFLDFTFISYMGEQKWHNDHKEPCWGLLTNAQWQTTKPQSISPIFKIKLIVWCIKFLFSENLIINVPNVQSLKSSIIRSRSLPIKGISYLKRFTSPEV